MEWLDETRSDDPDSPDGRRFIALLQKELSDKQTATLDIRDFIVAGEK